MKVHVVLRLRGDGGRTLNSTTYDLRADEPLTFGRAAQHNRLHVPDEKRMVSSRHGRIELRADGCHLIDLGSVNGTQLDGRPVEPEAPLRDGSTIAIGDFELAITFPDQHAPVADGDGLDSTLHSFDPDRQAAVLWTTLCLAHARLRRAAPAERQRQLLAQLRDGLRRLRPGQARAVLKRLDGRSGGTAAPTAATPDEELLQSALAQLQRLTQSLLSDRRLVQPRDAVHLCQQLETYVRLTLGWLVHSLKGRAEFESEFGAEVTMVFQRSNNPLKGLEPKDLARRLFDWSDSSRPGEMHTQLEGILRDLTQHQLGLLGGVTEAIRSVTERLAPAAIETLAQKDAGLLTSKGAKAWEIYTKIYRELLEEKSKLFHEVISPAIRKGYLMVHEDGGNRPADPRRD